MRVSGPRAAHVVARVLRAEQPGSDEAGKGGPERLLDRSERGASEVRLPVASDGIEGELPALLVWMPGPRSFTVEDVAELHVLGHPEWSQMVLESVLRAGARLAEPGEFTRRAFENGRIDLTRAEGVAALVAARSEDERRAAIALLSGGLERRIDAIRASLESGRALAEASLDFDEADTGHVPLEEICALGLRANQALEEALGWERSRATRSAAPRVVLTGAPNAGKSTLFNALAGGDLFEASGPALVSDVAGTTRDVRRAHWTVVPGFDVQLIDTAGRPEPRSLESSSLESSSLESGRRAPGGIESEADERAAREIEAADLVLWVVDGARAEADADLRDGAGGAPPAARAGPAKLGIVVTKGDLAQGAEHGFETRLEALAAPTWWVSAATGEGLHELSAGVAHRLGRGPDELEEGGGHVTGLGARHLAALREAREALDAGLHAAREGIPLDLVAEDLRAATSALDAIVGKTTPEDLLSRIFAQFCLGK